MRSWWPAVRVLGLCLLVQVKLCKANTNLPEFSLGLDAKGHFHRAHEDSARKARLHHQAGLSVTSLFQDQERKQSEGSLSNSTSVEPTKTSGEEDKGDKGNLGEWCGWWAEILQFSSEIECKASTRKLMCDDNLNYLNHCCIAPVPLRIPTQSERKRGSPIFKDNWHGKCDRLIATERQDTLENNAAEVAREKGSDEGGNATDPDIMLVDCTSGSPETDKDGSRNKEVLDVFERFRPWNEDPTTCCSGKVAPVHYEWFLFGKALPVKDPVLYCAP